MVSKTESKLFVHSWETSSTFLKGIGSETTTLIHLNLPPHLSQAPLPQAEQETFCTKPNSAALMPPPVLGTACQIQGHAGDVQCAECWARSLESTVQGSSCTPSHCGKHSLGIHVGERHQSWSHRLQKHKAEPVPAWGLQHSNQEQTRIQRLLCKCRGPLAMRSISAG